MLIISPAAAHDDAYLEEGRWHFIAEKGSYDYPTLRKSGFSPQADQQYLNQRDTRTLLGLVR
jgi:hypothetical protein